MSNLFIRDQLLSETDPKFYVHEFWTINNLIKDMKAYETIKDMKSSPTKQLATLPK